MNRMNVYDYSGDETVLAGWYDDSSAQGFLEATYWDGNNHISRATGSQWDHEELIRTKGGRWVLHRFSQRQGSTESREFVTADQAKAWLLSNEDDKAAAEHFGPIEDERGPGRPEVGPAINVRLPTALLDKVDEWASEHETTRAGAIRILLADNLPGDLNQ